MSLRAASQILNKTKNFFEMSEILLEIVNNKSSSAVRSGRKSCRINMTVLLSFEEKTDDARACAQSGHCPFNRRISELICENRTHLAAPVGCGGWWKTVDDITQRRTHSNSVVLEKHLCQPVEWLFSWTLDGPKLHCTSRCSCRERNRRTWDSWEACLEKSWQDQTNSYGSW